MIPTESFADASGVSVIMPVYNQAAFISRAWRSLQDQTFTHWELILINDGSTDNLISVIEPWVRHKNVTYLHHERNEGLGVALNVGLQRARYACIAYLPADDVYYEDHLMDLWQQLQQHPEAQVALSGVRHHYNRYADHQIPGYAWQLVQVMHRATIHRWMTRDTLVSDDLRRLFWHNMDQPDAVVTTGRVSAEWVDHPLQHHKIVQEPEGGLPRYKQYYGVDRPLRYHSTTGNYIDEITQYQAVRDTPMPPVSGLRILLVGELAYNADRILALAERGHQLYGLWMPQPYWYNTIGPLPFGHVEDVPYENWEEHIQRIRPDIIYAMLNWQAVPFAREVMMRRGDIPFVWHFKEGPFICLEKGTWSELIDLHTQSDGQLYSSPEMMAWFREVLPTFDPEVTAVLDGDLPRRTVFQEAVTPRLSLSDGACHTVVPGRPIGLHPHTVAELAAHHIHLHFYGDFTHGQWKAWIEKTQQLAPGYLHIHAHCPQSQWVQEFSQYDAGWLHFFQSRNGGHIREADWDDLNYPARLSTLAAAGLPMLQRDNTGHLVATQNLVQPLGLGIFFRDIPDLARQLHDLSYMDQLRKQVWQQRMYFSFDYHADDLIAFFKRVIRVKEKSTKAGISVLQEGEGQR